MNYKMPKMTESMRSVEIRFDQGMVEFDDPTEEGKLCRMSVYTFAERVKALKEMIEKESSMIGVKSKNKLLKCSEREFERFFSETVEFIKYCCSQIHVGMPWKVLEEIAGDKKEARISMSGGYNQRESGLIVPN